MNRPIKTLEDILVADCERSHLTKAERRVIRAAMNELRQLREQQQNSNRKEIAS